MEQKQRKAVYGWIRENYGDSFLNDIADIIYNFYRLILDSKILSEDEKIEFVHFLYDSLKQQNNHKTANIKSLDTQLLFRGSEHNFAAAEFHKYCDNKGPTITIIYNEHNRIFGGYVTKSWISESIGIIDPTAFLFTIRPKLTYIGFNNDETKMGIWPNEVHGPIFGRCDIFIDDECRYNSTDSRIFKFDNKLLNPSSIRKFEVKEYEVFSVNVA